ncbi:hypothetical protein GQ473_00245 [archaeon]|nr:hypothetical protein [archaeon]
MVNDTGYGSDVGKFCGVGSDGVCDCSPLDFALDLYQDDVGDYLSKFGFTPTFIGLLLQKTGVDDSIIPIEKQLKFLKFSKYSLESGYVDPVQLEQQYFGLYVNGMNLSDDILNEKIPILESWFKECKEKYGGVDCLCMREEIDILKNS